MSKRIKVVVIRPGEAPKQESIVNSLEVMQRLVGGYLGLISFTIGRKRFHFYVDEDAKLKRNPPAPNFVLGEDHIIGTAFVSRADSKGDEVGLTEPETSEVMAYVNTLRRL